MVEPLIVACKQMIATVQQMVDDNIVLTPPMSRLASGVATTLDEFYGADEFSRVLVGLARICPDCLRITHNKHDVANRFCAACAAAPLPKLGDPDYDRP